MVKLEIKTDPTAYIINSDALGDVIACLASLKYAVETYHKNGQYLVYILKEFKDLFFFIPKEKLKNLETDPQESFYIPNFLNLHTKGQRLHPLRITLSNYASLNLMTRIIPIKYLNYPKLPLATIDVSKFKIDFKNAVILSSIYKDKNRKWVPEELSKVCVDIISRGLTPIFLGKTSENYKEDYDYSYPPNINLVNKTSLLETAKIISMCKVIVGVDGGLIHLAGMTEIGRAHV